MGAMGQPMARHLLDAGFPVGVWARRRESAQGLCTAGAGWHESPGALADWADVVVSIITSTADVTALAFGENGLAAGFRPGCVHVDMSTIAPAGAVSLARRYAAMGVGWLDAPVSGGEAGARAATLAIMAGGEAEVLARCEPVLRCFGPRVVHIGGAGSGQVAKACNQMVMVNTIAAAAEAMLLARAHGLDLARVRHALMGGSAGSRVLEVMGRRMVERDYGGGVEARLHHKDYALLLVAAHRAGAPLPVAGAVGQLLNALMGQGLGQMDSAVLVEVLARMSGRGVAHGSGGEGLGCP